MGRIPVVSSQLLWKDRWGGIKARWSIGRMHYRIDPGLYALGKPGDRSPVLVTANYKMSFDHLRKSVQNGDAWILVLDTLGINVWCAAGKGTFGTEELVGRIEATGLKQIVSHRDLILPQLSGPGVAAHEVRKNSGFRVIYGPVKASDLPTFLAAGLRATPEMRQKTFTFIERAVLIPVELVSALKWTVILSVGFFLLAGVGGKGDFLANAFHFGIPAVLYLFGGLIAGAVLTPLLLPWLPGRAFSLKGYGMGVIIFFLVTAFRGFDMGLWPAILEMLGWFLLVPALAAYLAMNFTGASTFTSLSGVKKEMKWAVPAEITAGLFGFFLWLSSRFIT